jgi:hypothetical protein
VVGGFLVEPRDNPALITLSMNAGKYHHLIIHNAAPEYVWEWPGCCASHVAVNFGKQTGIFDYEINQSIYS